MPKIIYPESEQHWLDLRTQDVTSTESAALLGLHPRLTLFELHQRKAGRYDVAFEATERTKWGTRLEEAIARGVGEDYAVKVRRASYYARHDDCRMGSSFDYEIVGIDSVGRNAYISELVDLYEDHGPGVLEIKNVDALVFLKDWLVEKNDDGAVSIEAPVYIEVQLQHQLECVNREWGVIAALVGGNRPIVVPRRRDREVGRKLVTLVDEFWRGVTAGVEPAPDFKLDANVIAKLYGFAEPGKVLDARGDERITSLCAQYTQWADTEKNAREEKQARKAELLTLIGDAEKVIAEGFTISCGLVGPAEVKYTREGYRNFKITPKKGKEAA
ncbi:MAG TPA: YqaJ viral recombinase family protein [Burkholderiaceae bacterium]|nr:YqaJ viral recombinase family protein [Burkholderiaceae bacterium]